MPQLTAQDAHELKLAHETANMLLNAEMKLRASLYRTESAAHTTEKSTRHATTMSGLPGVLLQMDSDGQMAVTKKPIPDKWKPDLSIPYEERYVNRFPGELEYLGLA